MTTEQQADQSALADNIKRTVDRTALHKVRKLADELESEEAGKRRLEKRALIIAAVVVGALGTWFVLDLIASDQKYNRGQTFEMPAKVTLPKRD